MNFFFLPLILHRHDQVCSCNTIAIGNATCLHMYTHILLLVHTLTAVLLLLSYNIDSLKITRKALLVLQCLAVYIHYECKTLCLVLLYIILTDFHNGCFYGCKM